MSVGLKCYMRTSLSHKTGLDAMQRIALNANMLPAHKMSHRLTTATRRPISLHTYRLWLAASVPPALAIRCLACTNPTLSIARLRDIRH